MKIKISDYDGKCRIVSVALDEKTAEDLSAEKVEHWYVQPEKITGFPGDEIISKDKSAIEQFLTCNNYDVFEIADTGTAYRYYDAGSIENGFFITGKCNSNCIMCPSSEHSRVHGQTSNIDDLIMIASHIPAYVSHITFTGGEPFMAGKEIFRLLAYCKQKFEHTEFQILTNGRCFAISDYFELLKESIPNNTILGIPLHGAEEKVHDSITQVQGSFNQTIKGIKRLQYAGIPVEIRIVVCRLNAAVLEDVSDLIVEVLGKVEYVSIIAMEMTGSAYKNRDKIWISYRDSFKFVEPAARKLIRAGINVNLYNYPLCTVPKGMWPICAKSISSWKVRFAEQCSTCKVRKMCGGVFSGTIKFEENELEPVL